MEIIHNIRFDEKNTVNIYDRKTIQDKKKEIIASIKVKGNLLKEGDIIDSSYIGRIDHNQRWIVKEIKERYTPKGRYMVDKTDIGAIAIVELSE